jgi:hypothetical protein
MENSEEESGVSREVNSESDEVETSGSEYVMNDDDSDESEEVEGEILGEAEQSRRSARTSRVPDRLGEYGMLCVNEEEEEDPKTWKDATLSVNSHEWILAI